MLAEIIDFILVHQVLFAGISVGILDLLFALNSNLKSNGILHALYVFLQDIKNKIAAAAKK